MNTNTLDLEKKYITLVKRYVEERDGKESSEKKMKMIEKEKNGLVEEINSLKDVNSWLRICEELFKESQFSLKVWAASTISRHNKERAKEMIDYLDRNSNEMQRLLLKGMRNFHKL